MRWHERHEWLSLCGHYRIEQHGAVFFASRRIGPDWAYVEVLGRFESLASARLKCERVKREVARARRERSAAVAKRAKAKR